MNISAAKYSNPSKTAFSSNTFVCSCVSSFEKKKPVELVPITIPQTFNVVLVATSVWWLKTITLL